MKSLIPVVMAGILGIYGMIVAVIISQKGTSTDMQSRTTPTIPSNKAFRTWPQGWSAGSAAW
jgi:V-type H+-transporting ATPase proteolipid subunit